jgi:hypothetical protein
LVRIVPRLEVGLVAAPVVVLAVLVLVARLTTLELLVQGRLTAPTQMGMAAWVLERQLIHLLPIPWVQQLTYFLVAFLE